MTRGARWAIVLAVAVVIWIIRENALPCFVCSGAVTLVMALLIYTGFNPLPM